MHNSNANLSETKAGFGMWIYIMSDCVLFAALFATYAVLNGQTFGNATPKEIVDLPYALLETLVLLTSSFTCGLALIASQKNKKDWMLGLLFATFLLGATFVGLEAHEFSKLISEGHGPQQSAFLSSFFALVGTHGLHVSIGLLWLLILMIYVAIKGLSERGKEKLFLFSLFWHFLDIVWICIFTFVYLFGLL